MIREINSPNAAPGNFTKLSYAPVCVVWALLIGIVVWFADPKASFESNENAKDSFYNLLVQGFRSGQLNLNKSVPAGLANLSDPYDPNLNKPYLKGIVDLSYYKGKLYLYFGVTPALVLFWPYTTLTGHYLPDRVAIIIFLAIGFVTAGGLLLAIWRRYLPGENIWIAAASVFLLSLTISLTVWSNVNEVARTCGFAFTMLALAALWRAMSEPEQEIKWLLLASLVYGLAIGALPSLLFGAVIFLLPAIWVWRTAGEKWPRINVLLAAAAGPMVLIGLGLMLYNDLRFGNPLELGWHYELGDYRLGTAKQFSSHYLSFNIDYYFLEPIRWANHFPFLLGTPTPALPPGYLAQVPAPGGGLLVNYPIILAVLGVPWIWKGRPKKEVYALVRFITAVFLLFLICAVTLCLYFTAGKSYEMNFLPPLLLLVVIGILGLERALASLSLWRWIARGCLCLLLVYSAGFNLLENIESHAVANCFAGNSLLSQGHFDLAITQYQKALALWPDSADARCGLASALLQKGRRDEAIIQYQKTLEIDPDYAEAHLNLGACFLQKGRIDDAIAEYQKAIALNPASAIFHNALGNALAQKGDINNAIVQYQKTIEISPDFAEAYYNLAACLFQLGRLDDALAQYKKAIELQPASADFYNGLGNVLLAKQRVDEAAVQYQKALDLNPAFAEAHYNLGYCLFQQGRVDNAIVEYQKTIALLPNLAQAYQSLGDAYHQKGMETKAKTAYQKANELSGKPVSSKP